MNRHVIEEEIHGARECMAIPTLSVSRTMQAKITTRCHSSSAGIQNPPGLDALLVWFSVTWGLFLGGLACWAFAGPLVCLSPNIFSPKAQVVPPLSLPVAGGRSPSLRQIPPLYPHFRCLPSALLPGLSLANEAVRTSSNRKSACTILQAHGDLKAGYL